MTRLSPFNSPLLLGFEHLEQILERVAKNSNDGYPPYNILQVGDDRLRISLAVAGFSEQELSVTVEQNQLHIHGRQQDDADAVYLHRGIAARRFHRTFLLAETIEVDSAALDNGLLNIDLVQPVPAQTVRTIEIKRNAAKRGKKTQLFEAGRDRTRARSGAS
ncbi:MAG: Hsp20 family protein [Alphaproteobacteria bacterium]|jgi:HSP20 family molecular chaperone IbpA|nr:Hsp20 family protein [Alphaproteobacteria bacterium]MDP6589295.1 Hsp20 family protein [Alphaproteobacteria bacterium]MDP6817256.1 Hsp20 family protein [Alphaproteobacteria bacterium]|tara:strand:- start:542 stop:1027 length:486 start_codon:yes stop_codon:yes gene_type:complete